MERVAQLLFGPFRLDPQKKQLRRGDMVLGLRPMAVSVLRVLLEHAGEVLTKEQLLKSVWAGTYVNPTALKVCISEIREALGDERTAPRYIETVGREGYRFISLQEQRRESLALAGEVSGIECIVGRQREAEQLEEWFGKARCGARQIVFVTGEAGIGKTTLVDLFLARIQPTNRIRIGRGQCLEQYGEGEPYLPILEAFGRLCRESRIENLLPLLSQYAPTWLVQMPALLSNADLANLQQRAQGATRPRMLREMAETLEAISVETPLVFILEDLHWSDHSTLDLIAYLAQRQERARLLVIGTYRPTDLGRTHPLKKIKHELQVRQKCEEVPLQLLRKHEVTTYIAKRFPDRQTSTGLAKVIHRLTEGNALFMVNLVNELVNQGLILEKAGKWELQSGITDIKIPESLREVIEQKFIHLSVEERQILEAASVEGGEFSTVTIGAAVEKDAVEVEEYCATLVRSGQFIQERETLQWPDGTITVRYGFVHSLYQEVLYNQLTPGKRAQLHLRIGERLEQAYGDRTREIAAELALDFEQGRDNRRAITYHQQAANTAMQRFAYHESVVHLKKALALLKTMPNTSECTQQELFLQTSLGAALIATQGFSAPEVGETYTRARELCKQMGETSQLFPVLRGLTAFYSVRGDHQTTRELAEQCLKLVQHEQDSTPLIGAHLELGSALFYLGEFPQALKHLERGSSFYDPQLHSSDSLLYGYNLGVSCLSRTATCLWFLGYPDRALKKSQEAIVLAKEQQHPFSLAYALSFATECYRLCREGQTTRESADTIIALSEEQGFPMWAAGATIFRGWSLVEQGEYEDGIVQLKKGLAVWQAMGAEVAMPSWLAQLAEAYKYVGQFMEGLTILAKAMAVTNKNDERWWEAELYRLQGELILQQESQTAKVKPRKSRVLKHKVQSRGPQSEAEACFLKAIAIAQRQQTKSLELRAATSLARLWQRQEKLGEAQHVLSKVYNWFTEGFDTADLRDARALLDELRVGVVRDEPSALTIH